MVKCQQCGHDLTRIMSIRLAVCLIFVVIAMLYGMLSDNLDDTPVNGFYASIDTTCQSLSAKSGGTISVDYCVSQMTRNHP
jgi:hypothetical protein